MKTYRVKTIMEVEAELLITADTEERALNTLEDMDAQDILDEAECLGACDTKMPTLEIVEEEAHYDIFVHDLVWDAADVADAAECEDPINLKEIKAYTIKGLDVYNPHGEIEDLTLEDAIEDELDYVFGCKPLTYKYRLLRKY